MLSRQTAAAAVAHSQSARISPVPVSDRSKVTSHSWGCRAARVAGGKPFTRVKLHRNRCKRDLAQKATERSSLQSSVGQDGQSSTEIPTRLNDTPQPRHKRKWFYDEAAAAVVAALTDGVTRMRVKVTIPELNPEMDVYRIGTLLEMVREIAYVVALDGKKVKVCVQQALGEGVFQGLPLTLSGVRKIMTMMDWGDIGQFVTFGEVGRDQIDDAAYYILVSPQNVVGNTILTNLGEMVDEAESQGKAVILINPVLKDIPSAAGIMGVRGRAERMAFADSFTQAYHFRLLYMARALMYPIMGAMRYTYGQQWEVWRRQPLGKKDEKYELLNTYPAEPRGKELTEEFKNKPKVADSSKPFWASL